MIAGSVATLAVPGPFYQPGPMTLTSTEGDVLAYDEPQIAYQALYFQAAEVARYITAGQRESGLPALGDAIATPAGDRRDPPRDWERVQRRALTGVSERRY